MLTRKNKRLLLKIFSLFSVVRGYNILVIALAQYLTSIFILAPERSTREVILDPNLLMLVWHLQRRLLLVISLIIFTIQRKI